MPAAHVDRADRTAPRDSFDPTCDFCRIARRKGEARVVFESPRVVAFFPDFPVALGHTLVVPKEHTPDILSANARIVTEVGRAVRRVGRAVQQVVKPEGVMIVSSVGSAASQSVYHLHVHVVPRWDGDAMGDIWPPSPKLRASDQDRTARLLRAACQEPQ